MGFDQSNPIIKYIFSLCYSEWSITVQQCEIRPIRKRVQQKQLQIVRTVSNLLRKFTVRSVKFDFVKLELPSAASTVAEYRRILSSSWCAYILDWIERSLRQPPPSPEYCLLMKWRRKKESRWGRSGTHTAFFPSIFLFLPARNNLRWERREEEEEMK